MNDLAFFSNAVAAWMATYLLHSTLLFALCWLLLTLNRSKSHFLAARMWKLAAVLGIVTAVLQTVAGTNPILRFVLHPAESPATVNESPETMLQIQSTVSNDKIVPASPELVAPEPVVFLADDGSDLKPAIEPYFAAGVGEFQPRGVRAVARRPPVDLTAETSAEQFLPQTASLPEAHSLARQPEAVRRVWLNLFSNACSLMLVGGLIAGSMLLGIQTLKLHISVEPARVIRNGPARIALDRFLKRYKVRGRIRLLASENHCEPFAYGLFRWTIVLPEGAEDRLERNELQALLAHEVAHLVRGDVRWLWVGRMLCTCYAFQPLNFLARRRWQHAAEYLCDDWAIERGIRPLSLACCLTEVAQWRFGAKTPEVGLAAGGSKATLVQRVERLVDEPSTQDVWQRPRCRRLLVLGAALVSVAIVALGPRVALPHTAADQRVSHARVASMERSSDEPALREWLALQEELLQLEADLQRVCQLTSDNRSATVASHLQNLNRRTARLQARREYITSLLERKSQR